MAKTRKRVRNLNKAETGAQLHREMERLERKGEVELRQTGGSHVIVSNAHGTNCYPNTNKPLGKGLKLSILKQFRLMHVLMFFGPIFIGLFIAARFLEPYM